MSVDRHVHTDDYTSAKVMENELVPLAYAVYSVHIYTCACGIWSGSREDVSCAAAAAFAARVLRNLGGHLAVGQHSRAL